MAICHATFDGGPRRNWVLRPLPDAALIPIYFIGVARLSYQFGLPRANLGHTRLRHGDFAVAATARTRRQTGWSCRAICWMLWRSLRLLRLRLRASSSSGGMGRCNRQRCVFIRDLSGGVEDRRGESIR